MKVGEGNHSESDNSSFLLFTVYYLTIFIYLIAFFFPEQRLWAWNTLAYLSPTIQYSFLGVALVIPIAIRWISTRLGMTETDNKKQSYTIIAIVVLSVIAFYFLRIKAYVLGDGYALLNLLNSDNPLLKTRELGESLAHIFVKNSVAGLDIDAPLFSFQFISILSGFLFVLISAVSARSLFDGLVQRILFVLAILSGGYTLLFFGYVENYSLFVTSVLLYSLTLLSQKKSGRNKLVVLLFNLLAIFFHIFGLALIPATIYYCLRDARIGKRADRIGKLSRLLILAGLSVIAIIVFAYFYQRNVFLRYSVLPIIPNEFTTEGYFLFSLKHLIDYVNLLFLLIPGAGVGLLYLIRERKSISSDRGQAALLVASSVGFAFAFLFDPKIGMPRDWDLFSFAAVPLIVFVSYLLVQKRTRSSLITLLSIIMLGYLSLFARVLLLNNKSASIDCTIAYFDLDPRKNMNSFGIVYELLEQQGDSIRAEEFMQKHVETFTEKLLNEEGKRLLDRKRHSEALTKFNAALKINPSMGSLYFNRGLAYGRMRQYEQAIVEFEIVRSLHPYNAKFPGYISFVYLQMGRYDEAEKYARIALAMDEEQLMALRALFGVYKQNGDRTNYLFYLTKAANHKDAAPSLCMEMAEVLARSGYIEKSGEYVNLAIKGGIDSTLLNQFLKMYPDIIIPEVSDKR